MRLSKFKKKKIFCIEGNWGSHLKDKASIKTALEFLENNVNIKSIRRDCSTNDQFISLLKTSIQQTYKTYGIIYLAFHGSPGKLHLGKRVKIDFNSIADTLSGRANDKIIHFGSCSSLNINAWELRRFWKATGALAISGYTKDIGFVESSVFDILYFKSCQEYRKIPVIEKQMKKYYGRLISDLGFKIIYQK